MLMSGEAQAIIGCHGNLQSATGIRDTILQQYSVPLYPQAVGGFTSTIVLVEQPGSVSRAVSVSGLNLLLALTKAQLLSNFEAMLGHCCPLF